MPLCWVSRFLIILLNVKFLNVVILNVLMLNVVMLNVIMLSVVMLNVIAPVFVRHLFPRLLLVLGHLINLPFRQPNTIVSHEGFGATSIREWELDLLGEGVRVP